MSQVAIVILNYNGKDFLDQFLPPLIEHSDRGEIIVADNDSTDESLALLSDKYPDIRTIALDQNYGFAGGYNKALEGLEYDYYLLINSDIEVKVDRRDGIVFF